MSGFYGGRIEFRQSLAQPLFVAVGCLPFVVVTLLLMVRTGIETWEQAATYGFGLLFFGGGLVFCIWALFNRDPHIVVAGEGLLLPGATDELIPWNAIAHLAIYKVGGYQGLGPLLHEPQRHLGSGGLWRKLLNGMTRAQGYHIAVTTTGLNGSRQDIERAIRHFSGRRFPA